MDLARRDDRGMTVLHVAAARRGTDAKDDGRSLVQLLIDTGADILARDAMQMTVLHHLVAGGRRSRRGITESRAADIARVVAAAPGLVLAVNDQGETPLHLALGQSANLENAHALIKAGADVKAHVGSTGDGLLHLLFRQEWVVGPKGDVQIRVKSDRRRTVDATDEADEGADMLQRLLEMGLDINARNSQGKTPVFGLFERSEEWAKDADEVRSGRKTTDSDSKAAEREEVICDLLEAQGVNWTVTDSKGATLLHIVAGGDAQMGDFDAQATRRVRWFRFLMSRGVDLDAEDEQHRTPLDVAASKGREELLELVR
jgi:ankyrin repeat protein